MSLDNEDLSSSATLIETANHGTPGHRKRDVEAITSHIHKTELGEIHRVPSPDWCWSRQTPSFRPALARHAGTSTGPEHAPFDIASAELPHGQIHPPTQIRMCTESGSMQVPERWRRIWVPARSGRGGWGGEGPDPAGGGVGVGGDSIFGIKPPSRGSCKLRCHGRLPLLISCMANHGR